MTTKQFNQAVKRNIDRFPGDFMFQLSTEEDENLRSQFVTSRSEHGGRRYRPYAFTEHGAVMAAMILNNPRAVEVSVYVVRAFIQMREMMITQTEWAYKLERIERRLQERFAYHEDRLDDQENQLEQIIETLHEMQQQHVHRPIGFRTGEGDE